METKGIFLTQNNAIRQNKPPNLGFLLPEQNETKWAFNPFGSLFVWFIGNMQAGMDSHSRVLMHLCIYKKKIISYAVFKLQYQFKPFDVFVVVVFVVFVDFVAAAVLDFAH